MTHTRYNPKESAAQVRKVLKATFPGQKFSVTTSCSGGYSQVLVRWDDGPATAEVEAAVGHMCRQISTLVDDSPVTRKNNPYDVDWVSCSRTISSEFYIEMWNHLMTFVPAEFARQFELLTSHGRTYIDTHSHDASLVLSDITSASRPGKLAEPQPHGGISYLNVPAGAVEVQPEPVAEAAPVVVAEPVVEVQPEPVARKPYYTNVIKMPVNMRGGLSNFLQMIINNIEAGNVEEALLKAVDLQHDVDCGIYDDLTLTRAARR